MVLGLRGSSVFPCLYLCRCPVVSRHSCHVNLETMHMLEWIPAQRLCLFVLYGAYIPEAKERRRCGPSIEYRQDKPT
jgi:hypothetical protein